MSTPQEIIQTIDLNDFKTKATLMALGASAFTGDLDKCATDFDKVDPELQQVLLSGLAALHLYIGALLEKIDPTNSAIEYECPDLLEVARMEMAEDLLENLNNGNL